MRLSCRTGLDCHLFPIKEGLAWIFRVSAQRGREFSILLVPKATAPMNHARVCLAFLIFLIFLILSLVAGLLPADAARAAAPPSRGSWPAPAVRGC